MPQDNDQERYEDILKRIANRKPFGEHKNQQPKSAYDLILDTLNAYDTLATLPLLKYENILCYGPKVIRKTPWSAVVIWYLNKGYYGYQTLYLFGVWVLQRDADIVVSTGIRKLHYQAAVYNAEGFHASIRKGFKLYYEDIGKPPTTSDTILFETIYQQKERLTLRQTLQNIVTQWKLDKESD